MFTVCILFIIFYNVSIHIIWQNFLWHLIVVFQHLPFLVCNYPDKIEQNELIRIVNLNKTTQYDKNKIEQLLERIE